MAASNTLLDEIRAFLAEEGMEPTTFGRMALNDPNFVRDLDNGRRVWPETAEKAQRFMAEKRAAHLASQSHRVDAKTGEAA